MLQLFFCVFFLCNGYYAWTMENNGLFEKKQDKQPLTLFDSCIRRLSKMRTSELVNKNLHERELQADAKIVGFICLDEKLSPMTIPLIKALPKIVIETYADEFVQALMSNMCNTTKTAIIEKLARHAIAIDHTLLKDLRTVARNNSAMKKTLNELDPLFKKVKNSLVCTFFNQGLLLKHRFDFGEAPDQIKWSFDGNYIIVKSNDIGMVEIWSIGDQASPILLHEDVNNITSIACSQNAEYSAVGIGYGIVNIWRKDILLFTYNPTIVSSTCRINLMSWSPDGKYLAIAQEDNTLLIWTMDKGLLVARRAFHGHKNRITSLLWSPDSNYIATTSCDTTTRIWSLDTACVSTLEHSDETVRTVTWSSDGKQLATGSGNGTIRVWNFAKQSTEQILTLLQNAERITSLAWLPDNKHLVAVHFNNRGYIWSIPEGICKNEFADENRALECSCDGKYLITGSDDGIRIINIDLPLRIRNYNFSYDEIILLEKIISAMQEQKKYTLTRNDAKLFNALASDDQEIQKIIYSAFRDAIVPYKVPFSVLLPATVSSSVISILASYYISPYRVPFSVLLPAIVSSSIISILPLLWRTTMQ